MRYRQGRYRRGRFRRSGFSSGASISAVVYDGVGDYLKHTSGPTGAADGSDLTLVWAGTFNSDGSTMMLVDIPGTVPVQLIRQSDNTIDFIGGTAGAVFSNSTTAVAASLGFLIVIAHCSGTSATLEVIHASGTITGTNTPGAASNLDLTADWYFGSDGGASSFLDADTAMWWADDSVVSTTEQFWDSTNDTLRDPGSDGSNPLDGDHSPLVCHVNPAASHTTNRGSGGDADVGTTFEDGTSPGAYSPDYVPSNPNQRVTAITIDATQVSDADTADLTDFPVLVTHATLITNDSEALDADGANPMQTDGGDLKFYSDAGLTTRLACEVVNVSLDNNPALSLLEVWVKVPTVDYNDDTTIYMTYDSLTGTDSQPAVGDTYGRNAVWSDYEAVLHLNTSGYVDSTGNGHTGSATGTPTQTTSNHPWGGTWTDFVPIEYLTLASSTGLVNGSTMTVQCWARANSASAQTKGMVSDDNASSTEHYRLTTWAGNVAGVNCTITESEGQYLAQPIVGTRTNPRLCAVLNDGSNAFGHVNTTRVTGGAPSGDGSFASTASTTIGSYNAFSSGLSWDGQIGEVRARKSVLTEGWLSTEYNNGNAPGTFATAAAPSSI